MPAADDLRRAQLPQLWRGEAGAVRQRWGIAAITRDRASQSSSSASAARNWKQQIAPGLDQQRLHAACRRGRQDERHGQRVVRPAYASTSAGQSGGTDPAHVNSSGRIPPRRETPAKAAVGAARDHHVPQRAARGLRCHARQRRMRPVAEGAAADQHWCRSGCAGGSSADDPPPSPGCTNRPRGC